MLGFFFDFHLLLAGLLVAVAATPGKLNKRRARFYFEISTELLQSDLKLKRVSRLAVGILNLERFFIFIKKKFYTLLRYFGALIGQVILAAKLPPCRKIGSVPLIAVILHEQIRLFPVHILPVHGGANNIATLRQMLDYLQNKKK